ncbi:type II CAAX endopeptidase family protein [Microbacterium betulae]|uniref:Type II CAAX endopeptidase family protein n=1 Tax=Microbacterium betulae TaxID=2981139 RepID=A0AA97FFU6_9MICO|nr:type II CAAX endopeptidase family protein [Microbacterium sp. AB]WOF22255.1 type II CAAX endopeptidase family protein [Microbacterium sp. AB]
MTDQPSDAPSTMPPRGPRRSARTWRSGSRTTRRWGTDLLAWAAVCVGLGLLLAAAVEAYLPRAPGEIVGTLVLVVAMAVSAVVALRRGRPRGLLELRPSDLLYGVALGLLLRIAEGSLALAAGDSGALPAFATLDGEIPVVSVLTTALLSVLVAPVVEELLFRGVVLVTVFRIARRGVDGALLALVASTAAFVGLHAVTGMTRWDQPVTLSLVGLTCGILVLTTGRIWGAVLVHAVFNASYVVLAVVGTVLG